MSGVKLSLTLDLKKQGFDKISPMLQKTLVLAFKQYFYPWYLETILWTIRCNVISQTSLYLYFDYFQCIFARYDLLIL